MTKDLKSSNQRSPTRTGAVDQFLDKVRNLPPAVRGQSGQYSRIGFIIDATASRQTTWDMASQVQGEMLDTLSGINIPLSLQVLWFRGFQELKKTPWSSDGKKLAQLMSAVSCQAGQTQIERSLREILRQSRQQQIRAAVFIGDCCEEPEKPLLELAGKLALVNTPLFVFQEGHNQTASAVFDKICARSGGAWCQFSQSSPGMLLELLSAVAIFATGGAAALAQLPSPRHPETRQLLEQIKV